MNEKNTWTASDSDKKQELNCKEEISSGDFGLNATEDLVLPQQVEGDFGLNAAEDLVLPQQVEGDLDLKPLIDSEEGIAEIMANPELYYQTEENVKETEKGRTR